MKSYRLLMLFPIFAGFSFAPIKSFDAKAALGFSPKEYFHLEDIPAYSNIAGNRNLPLTYSEDPDKVDSFVRYLGDNYFHTTDKEGTDTDSPDTIENANVAFRYCSALPEIPNV